MENEERSENVRLGQARLGRKERRLAGHGKWGTKLSSEFSRYGLPVTATKSSLKVRGVSFNRSAHPEGDRKYSKNSAANPRAVNSCRCGFVRGHKCLFMTPQLSVADFVRLRQSSLFYRENRPVRH
jgi:hypothetical protein